MAASASTRLCAWCQQPFDRPPRGSGQPQVYCSRLHQEWAYAVAMGKYPPTDCPRCGRHDLRIAAPDWAICQTCGYQTDRPDLPVGVLTPRNMSRSTSDIKRHLAQSVEK